MLKSMRPFAVATIVAFALSACGGGGDGGQTASPATDTIAAQATARGFTSLVAAADKAGLLPTLNDGNANLTLFAPTDAAFATMADRLGFGSATAMIAALDGATWAKVLQFHMLPARRLQGDITAGGTVQATRYVFEGAARMLGFTLSGGVMSVSDDNLSAANVAIADVAASNGVIHVIDKVLVPAGVLNVAQMVQLSSLHTLLAQALAVANLNGTLSAAGPVTLFAPHDAAFNAVMIELNLTQAQLLASPSLAGTLGYHGVTGKLRSADLAALPKPASITTVQGTTFTLSDPVMIVDGHSRLAFVVGTHLSASNGAIHMVNRVMLPAGAFASAR